MAPVNRNSPKRAASSESQYSLMEFLHDFPDDETCLNWLWKTRYAVDEAGEQAMCPRCDEVRIFRRYVTKQQRQSWTCTHCSLNVHPTAGTIFHKSSTSLHLWFYAIYLMTSTRCGISAKQLEREIGCTYKTAWRMFHLIRNELMEQPDEKLSGQVEADETFIGGRPRVNERKSRAQYIDRKAIVFGAVERNGRVIAKVTRFRNDVNGHVIEHVLPDSTLYTDEYGGYNGLAK
jgi:transposase